MLIPLQKIQNGKKLMTEIRHDLPIDSKVQRLKRRYQGLSRVAAAINDLYIYGVYPSNFPNLTVVLEQAKDHCKELIKETKKEIAFVENPNGLYDLVYDEIIEDADTETAKRKAIDISGLQARQFAVTDFDTFDLIYVMDHSNYDNVVRIARNEADRNKVQLILELLPNQMEIEVPDPYYGGQDGFEHVFDLLDKSTDIILNNLRHE
mgnify:CR=1 FL=1